MEQLLFREAELPAAGTWPGVRAVLGGSACSVSRRWSAQGYGILDTISEQRPDFTENPDVTRLSLPPTQRKLSTGILLNRDIFNSVFMWIFIPAIPHRAR